jgi:hypothetical protein
MNRRYAHLPRTALALLAAAGTVWLAAFFLPGAVVEPIPLLPSIGSAAGKVVQAPALRAQKHAARHRTTTAILAVDRAPLLAATAVSRATPVRQAHRAVQRTQPARPRHHAPRPKHSAPVQKDAPAQAPAATTATRVFYGKAPSGRAVGWHRKHDQASAPAAVASVHGHGHGNGHGQHDAPAVQPAPSPAAPVAAPSAPTDGHDNGKHLGDQHDHGDQGHGPGGKQ